MCTQGLLKCLLPQLLVKVDQSCALELGLMLVSMHLSLNDVLHGSSQEFLPVSLPVTLKLWPIKSDCENQYCNRLMVLTTARMLGWNLSTLRSQQIKSTVAISMIGNCTTFLYYWKVALVAFYCWIALLNVITYGCFLCISAIDFIARLCYW